MSQTQISNQIQVQENKRWFKLKDLVEFEIGEGVLSVRLTKTAEELINGFNNFVAKIEDCGNVVAVSLTDLDENIDIFINKHYPDYIFIVDAYYGSINYYIVPLKKAKELNIAYIEEFDDELIFNVVVDPEQGEEFLVYRVVE